MSKNNTISRDALRRMVANPNGTDFKGRYLSLGRGGGKKQLQLDCKTNGIRATVAAFQIIENGYSHREKITYANDQTRCDYDFGRLGNNSESSAKRVGKGLNNGDIDAFGRTIVKIETEEMKRTRLVKEQKEKEDQLQRLKEEHTRKLEKKKERRMEKMTTKMAALDSWEDF